MPVPVRVCSDRGLMDINVINHPTAFPDAHINVDPWHFQELFTKTLNKGSSVHKDVSLEFKKAMYTEAQDSDGRTVLTHAEPEAIVATVDGLIKRYSHAGIDAAPAITKKTKDWWEAQKGKILVNRMCSHPRMGDNYVFKMASSPLENYHRQLNRVLRNIVRCSEETMHVFLMQFMFRWNIDRRRALGADVEPDWHTYDLRLVDDAYQACVKATGTPAAAELWTRTFTLPAALYTYEDFGLYHEHVTLGQRMVAVQGHMPYSDMLLANIISKHTPAARPIPETPTGCPPTASDALSSAPLSRMSTAERAVLATLRRDDLVMQQAIRDKLWADAAVRWNSLCAQCGGKVGDTAVNRVHGDLIRQAVAALDNSENRRIEHLFIQQAEQRAAKALDDVIPYVPVSPVIQPWSRFEDTFIREMVGAYTNSKGQVSWQRIAKRWYLTYLSQVESKKPPRVAPRTDEMLRSRWNGRLKNHRDGDAEESEFGMATEDEDGVSSVVSDEKEEVKEDVEVKVAHSDTPAVPSSAPLFSLAARPFTTLRAWMHPLPTATTSSTSTSSSSSSSPLPSVKQSQGAQTAQNPHPRQKPRRERRAWHWSGPATKKFIELGIPSQYQWTFDEFVAVWPTEEFGYINESRFKNKNRIEKLQLSAGSRVKDRKKRKGAGERHCAVDCNEDHQHKRRQQ